MRGAADLDTLTAVLLILVAAVILATWVGNMNEGQRGSIDEQSCKLSITKAQLGKTATFGAYDFGVTCPRQTIEFTTETPEVMSQKIFEKMESCAARFNYGGVDFGKLNWIVPPTKGNCMICASIEFSTPESILSYSEEKLLTDMETLGPRFAEGSWKDYFDSVEEKANTKQQDLLYEVDFSLEPSKGYEIIFMNVQAKGWATHLVTKFDFMNKANKYFQGETPYPTNFVMLVESDKRYELCENLLN